MIYGHGPDCVSAKTSATSMVPRKEKRIGAPRLDDTMAEQMAGGRRPIKTPACLTREQLPSHAASACSSSHPHARHDVLDQNSSNRNSASIRSPDHLAS